jgi:hypothetical protein
MELVSPRAVATRVVTAVPNRLGSAHQLYNFWLSVGHICHLLPFLDFQLAEIGVVAFGRDLATESSFVSFVRSAGRCVFVCVRLRKKRPLVVSGVIGTMLNDLSGAHEL